jgi:hypothetical protein
VQRGATAASTSPSREAQRQRHEAPAARSLEAGLTDVHLLPVFDIASVPEVGCTTPSPAGAADCRPAQQAAVAATRRRRLLQLGLRPLALQRARGQLRQRRGRPRRAHRASSARMVQALHAAGLRVGMDVVYNHTTACGPERAESVLDRIVPGYYHRLNAGWRRRAPPPAATTPPPSTA